MTNQTSGGRQPVVLPRTFYLDASALVKRYLVETGSAWVKSICADEEGSAIAIAHFGLVETAAAFAAKQRGQFITSSEHESVLADLLRDAKIVTGWSLLAQPSSTALFSSRGVRSCAATMRSTWRVPWLSIDHW